MLLMSEIIGQQIGHISGVDPSGIHHEWMHHTIGMSISETLKKKLKKKMC